jgi:putative membrane protein
MAEGEKDIPDDVLKARAIVEKKTAINLIEAFAVAVKHYLRGEDGIFYSDLYHLVKYLPAYALPSGIPSEEDLSHSDPDDEKFGAKPGANLDEKLEVRIELPNRPNTPLPQPIRLARRSGRFSMIEPPQPTTRSRPTIVQRFMPNRRHDHFSSKVVHNDKDEESALPEEENLFPAYMPPKWHFYDIFPLSILARWLTKKGKEVKGKRAAKLRAKLRNDNVSHNLPLEITFYLVCVLPSSWLPFKR